jgi:hypothetical protein
MPGLGTNPYELSTDSGEVKHLVLPDHSTVLLRGDSRFTYSGDSAPVMVGHLDGEMVLDIPEGRSWIIHAGTNPVTLSAGRYAFASPSTGAMWMSVAHGRAIWMSDTVTVNRAGLFAEYSHPGPSGLQITESPERFPRWWGWERAPNPVRDSIEAAIRGDRERKSSGQALDVQARLCDATAMKIRMDQGLTRYNARQFGQLGDCPGVAGELLAAAWAGVGDDGPAVRELTIASRRIRDGRIEHVLFQVVGDEAKPAIVRQAALGILAGYLDGRFATIVARDPVDRDRYEVMVPRLDEVSSKQGAVPLSPDVGDRVSRLLADLRRRGTSDPLGRIAGDVLVARSAP